MSLGSWCPHVLNEGVDLDHLLNLSQLKCFLFWKHMELLYECEELKKSAWKQSSEGQTYLHDKQLIPECRRAQE